MKTKKKKSRTVANIEDEGEKPRAEVPQAETPRTIEPQTDYYWLAAGAAITIVSVLLRFAWLAIKPLHHDEGVNGFFLTNLVRDGIYKYDPANYHGPTLYYIAFPFVKLFGLETIPIRASVAIFGVLTVILALFLKRYIGRIGSLLAALFLALSPGMVYISRYFIHEIFFVFLSLAIVVAILFFIEKRRAGYFAIGWMVLILLVCFLPSALNLATFLGGQNEAALWAFRVAFFVVEAVLVYFVIKMIVTWDEDDDLEGNRIATIFAGPMVKHGVYARRIDHYSVLRTLLDMYGLPPLGASAKAATIDYVWGSATEIGK